MTTNHTEAFIEQWHRIFEENDPELIAPLFDDDVEFCSPAIYAPKRGKEEVFALLRVVFDIFDGYRVTDTWIKGNEIMFEFEAGVGKYTLQGIDRFVLNDDGRVVQMKVWIRPLTGLQALARTVTQRGLDMQLAARGPFARVALRLQVRALKIRNAIKQALQ
jgi:hypothetical protein